MGHPAVFGQVQVIQCRTGLQPLGKTGVLNKTTPYLRGQVTFQVIISTGCFIKMDLTFLEEKLADLSAPHLL